jgi:dephospho-CoA kinase
MLFVGLTGGIGAGKSTVAALLGERGAVVVDSDVLAREAVARGGPGFDAAVSLFGPAVLDAAGDLDRAQIAAIVFADEEKRRALETIVHPEVGRGVAKVLEAHADTGDVVVLDSPLLVETGIYRGCDVVIVVRADPEVRLARLVDRGMTEADARARIATQASAEEQIAVADVVIENEGSPADLERRVDAVWRDLSSAAG